MEVFGDFQCPACRGFFETTVKQVIDDYVIPGKVYLVHRDFPLDMHPYARQAARLANAAAEFGEFEAMERALYDTQDDWSAKGNIDEVMATVFSRRAIQENFRPMKPQHMSEINASIERDRAMGIQRNVNQTPTVYVTSHGQDRSASRRRRGLQIAEKLFRLPAAPIMKSWPPPQSDRKPPRAQRPGRASCCLIGRVAARRDFHLCGLHQASLRRRLAFWRLPLLFRHGHRFLQACCPSAVAQWMARVLPWFELLWAFC